MVQRNKYHNLTIQPEDVTAEAYKRHFGGSAGTWDSRGAYQLALLRHLGLEPEHKLVDYGCGPLRAGRYLIRYLETGCYRGYDFNAGFIAIAQAIVAQSPDLRDKAPELVYTTTFLELDAPADFILLFSVLNHCAQDERLRALLVAREAVPTTQICMTHASWYFALDPQLSAGLSVRRIDRQTLPAALHPERWGWKEGDNVLPMIVLAADDPEGPETTAAA